MAMRDLTASTDFCSIHVLHDSALRFRFCQRTSLMKVVLYGLPHSGKSCLKEGLKQAIRRIKGAPYPYLERGEDVSTRPMVQA